LQRYVAGDDRENGEVYVMDIIDAIRERRSVRKFKKEAPVTDEVLREIMDAARFAPSWANTQVWEIIVVRDQASKDALSELLSPTNPSREAVKTAPVVLAACGKKGVSGFYRGQSSTVLGEWLMFDVALFLATLNLAAHAKGLSMVHVGFFDILKASAMLAVPDEVQLVELLPLGYADETPRPPKRREAADFLHFEKF
jgi:nitroreductase